MALLVLVYFPQYNRYPESRGDGGLRGTCISLMFFCTFQTNRISQKIVRNRQECNPHSQSRGDGGLSGTCPSSRNCALRLRECVNLELCAIQGENQNVTQNKNVVAPIVSIKYLFFLNVWSKDILV